MQPLLLLTTSEFPEMILQKGYTILQAYTEDLNDWEPFTILSLPMILHITPQN